MTTRATPGPGWHLESLTIPAQQGAAVIVHAGDVLRIVEIEGAQTCDFNAFVLPDLREHFSAGRTRHYAGIHPTVGDELWSNPPNDRPLFRIVADTLDENDLLFPRCSRVLYERAGFPNHRSCQENIAAAIAPHGLGPDDVHDSFNIFMKTRVEPDGRIVIEPFGGKVGDHLDLEVLVDCLVALSACPDGDKHGRQQLPLGVEIERAPSGP